MRFNVNLKCNVFWSNRAQIMQLDLFFAFINFQNKPQIERVGAAKGHKRSLLSRFMTFKLRVSQGQNIFKERAKSPNLSATLALIIPPCRRQLPPIRPDRGGYHRTLAPQESPLRCHLGDLHACGV